MKQLVNRGTVFIYFLFLFAGMMKWIVLNTFDPILICGTLCGLLLIHKLVLQINTIGKLWNWTNLFSLTLVLICCISIVYTSSNSFCYKKLIQLGLSLLAFYFPQLMFNEKSFEFVNKSVSFFLILALIILAFIFITSNYSFDYYISISLNKDLAIPSYLTISTFLVFSLLIVFNENSFLFIILKFITLSILLGLGARGPMLFLVLMYFLDYTVFHFRIKRIIIITSIIALSIFTLVISNTDLSNSRGIQRLTKLNSSHDHSVNERLRLIDRAYHVFENNPLMGSGFGSFAAEDLGRDIEEYPHNLFLEVASELGIYGLLVILLLLASLLFSIFVKLKSDKEWFFHYKGIIYAALFLFIESLKSGSFFTNKLLWGSWGILIFCVSIKTKKTYLIGAANYTDTNSL